MNSCNKFLISITFLKPNLLFRNKYFGYHIIFIVLYAIIISEVKHEPYCLLRPKLHRIFLSFVLSINIYLIHLDG